MPAKLYALKPFLQFSIGFIWLFSGLTYAFFWPKIGSYGLLAQIGINTFWQPIVLYSASTLDIALGIAMLCGWYLKKICILQIIVTLFYTFILTLIIPALWLDPLGPLTKNISLIAATLALFTLVEKK